MGPQGHRLLTDLTPRSTGSQADLDASAVFDPDRFAASGPPYEAFERLRHHAPVHPVILPDIEPKVWLCTRYDDVKTVSRDDDTFASRFGNTLVTVEMVESSAMLPGIDPPSHTHFRKLINKAFTPRHVLRLEDSIRQTARTIVDDVIEKGEFDEGGAVPLTAAVAFLL